MFSFFGGVVVAADRRLWTLVAMHALYCMHMHMYMYMYGWMGGGSRRTDARRGSVP